VDASKNLCWAGDITALVMFSQEGVYAGMGGLARGPGARTGYGAYVG